MEAVADRVLLELHGPSSELGQVLALLRAAGDPDPGAMLVGTGDRRLLDLAARLTGGPPEVAVACPGCGELNSVELSGTALPPAAPACAWWGPGGGLRPPTYADLEAAAEAGPVDGAGALLARCTVGTPPRPPTAADAAWADDTLSGPIQLACVACGEPVELDLDVQRVALERLMARAREVEREIHLLARAYQWDLATIEALPDARRRRLARLVDDDR
jgi:hypothetical protein